MKVLDVYYSLNFFMKKFLTYPLLIRLGLACAFLANALTAFFLPAEFQELVSGSFLATILPISVATFVIFIGINDLLLAGLLFFGWHPSYAATWAALWIIGVILVSGVFSLDALEHLAFLAMALAVALHGKSES